MDELRAQIDDFLAVVEPLHRRRAIFYVTEEFYAEYGVVTRGRELFVREVFAPLRWLDGRRWLFWQFDDGGRLEGTDGGVDLDAFRGCAEQLRALARRETKEVDPRP